MDGLIIGMSKLECYCGVESWFFIKDEDEIPNVYCIICKSSFYQIMNKELEDEYIKWLTSQWI